MSRENLELFIQRVLTDETLQEQIKTATNEEELIKVVLELAAGFTTDELQEVIQNATQERSLNTVLEELGTEVRGY